MDETQKVLIEAGYKDLAQEYYLKIAKPIETESDFKSAVSNFIKTIKSPLVN